MIRIGILGDIGSGKTFVAKNFGFPVFDADYEVSKLYQKDKKIFYKIKKIFPKYIKSFPIKKEEIIEALIVNNINLKKLIKIVHAEIRKKLLTFLKKNKNKRFVILDVPLLLENKLNKKSDVLIFIDSKNKDILKRLKKRKNFNEIIYRRFKNIQLPLKYKKKKAHFIIKNNFTKKIVQNNIKTILNTLI